MKQSTTPLVSTLELLSFPAFFITFFMLIPAGFISMSVPHQFNGWFIPSTPFWWATTWFYVSGAVIAVWMLRSDWARYVVQFKARKLETAVTALVVILAVIVFVWLAYGMLITYPIQHTVFFALMAAGWWLAKPNNSADLAHKIFTGLPRMIEVTIHIIIGMIIAMPGAVVAGTGISSYVFGVAGVYFGYWPLLINLIAGAAIGYAGMHLMVWMLGKIAVPMMEIVHDWFRPIHAWVEFKSAEYVHAPILRTLIWLNTKWLAIRKQFSENWK